MSLKEAAEAVAEGKVERLPAHSEAAVEAEAERTAEDSSKSLLKTRRPSKGYGTDQKLETK